MTEPHVLAVDQGTGSTKALLLNAAGAVVSRAQALLAQSHPGPGLVEQDAAALLAGVRTAVANVKTLWAERSVENPKFLTYDVTLTCKSGGGCPSATSCA